MAVNKTNGFTLIEIIIVIALITVLAALVAPAGIDFYHDELIERDTELLKTNLEKARDFAISGRLDSSWSIKFEANKYILFKGGNFAERNEDYDKEFTLSSGLNITSEEDPIVFEKISGKPSILEELTIGITYQERERDIKVDTEGLVVRREPVAGLPVNEGLVLHLDATTGITKDANDKLPAWADQSGENNDAEQATSARQPV